MKPVFERQRPRESQRDKRVYMCLRAKLHFYSFDRSESARVWLQQVYVGVSKSGRKGQESVHVRLHENLYVDSQETLNLYA